MTIRYLFYFPRLLAPDTLSRRRSFAVSITSSVKRSVMLPNNFHLSPIMYVSPQESQHCGAMAYLFLHPQRLVQQMVHSEP